MSTKLHRLLWGLLPLWSLSAYGSNPDSPIADIRVPVEGFAGCSSAQVSTTPRKWSGRALDAGAGCESAEMLSRSRAFLDPELMHHRRGMKSPDDSGVKAGGGGAWRPLPFNGPSADVLAIKPRALGAGVSIVSGYGNALIPNNVVSSRIAHFRVSESYAAVLNQVATVPPSTNQYLAKSHAKNDVTGSAADYGDGAIPPVVWLLVSGLLALAGINSRKPRRRPG